MRAKEAENEIHSARMQVNANDEMGVIILCTK